MLLATGCVGQVGEPGPGNNGGPDAGDTVDPTKKGPPLYKSTVNQVTAKCSGGGCHSLDAVSGALGKWWSTDADAAYTAITRAPTIVGTFSAIAPIITHIEAGHKGITYTPDEKTQILAWLAAETEDRAGGGGSGEPPPVDPKQVLKTFSGCLTLADFNAANMAQSWGALAADNNQKCQNCHQAGGDGFIASTNAEIMFGLMSEQSAYMLKFFTVDTQAQPAKIIINTGSFTNAGVTLAGHPRFNPTTNIGMIALQKFYDAAMLKQTGGTCGPGTLKDI